MSNHMSIQPIALANRVLSGNVSRALYSSSKANRVNRVLHTTAETAIASAVARS